MQTIMCAVSESAGAVEAIAVAAGVSEGLGLRIVRCPAVVVPPPPSSLG
jgi:hypothetical protein